MKFISFRISRKLSKLFPEWLENSVVTFVESNHENFVSRGWIFFYKIVEKDNVIVIIVIIQNKEKNISKKFKKKMYVFF